MKKTSNAETHRWVIDAIEEGVARIEEDGKHIIHVPVSELPAGAKEGQVLVGTRGEPGPFVAVVIDEDATSAANTASQAQTDAAMKESKRRDPGGNVSL